MSQPKITPCPLTFRLYTRFEKKKLTVFVVPSGDRFRIVGGTLELRLVHPQTNQALQRKQIVNWLAAAKHGIVFPLLNAPYGNFEFKASFTDRCGIEFPVKVLQDKLLEQPPGFADTSDVSRRLLAPWTPLKVVRQASDSEIVVECWGRRLTFDATSFVKRVTSARTPLLAAPMRLMGRVNGRAIHWKRGRLSLLASRPDQIVLRHDAVDHAITFTSLTQIDFDGCVRIDWSLSCKRSVRLDVLTIEIPIPASGAKYFYYYPGEWGNSNYVGTLPSEGIKLGFCPFFWLGDEERGLAWFTESDRHWFKADPDCVTEVKRQRGRAVLRVHLVSRPIELLPGQSTSRGNQEACMGPAELIAACKRHTGMSSEHPKVIGPLSYNFGFQATPVKPVTHDAWDHRIFCIMQKTPGFNPRFDIEESLLDRLTAAGVKTVVLFEHWTDVESHVATTYGPQLKRIVQACHTRDLKVLLYFGFLISDLAPEWASLGKDSLVIPKRGYSVSHYAPQPDQSAWVVCLQSAWQDILVHGIARVMDEFDVDGVYLDGTASPWGCCNTLHGCGARSADGSLAPTYPIWSVRSAMRRICTAIQSRKPDGQINIHNSTVMTTPTLAWGTSCWDGEQFKFLSRNKTDLAGFLPLDAFRAEFMGHQWGVPTEFLCYGQPLKYKESWAFTLLHDVPVRPMDPVSELELASKIWNVMDAFGRKEARWFPYWRNASYIEVSPPGAYVSFYTHPHNGLLAVVSNLRGEQASVRIRFHCEKLGLAAAENLIFDALTRRRLSSRPNQFCVILPPFGWRILWIKSN